MDLLFSSLAETQKENVIGVVLSGCASDGITGLKAITGAWGITLIQDDTAQSDQVSDSAIFAKVVDYILSLKGIAHSLVRRSKTGLSKNNLRKKEAKEKAEKAQKVILKNNNFDIYIIFKLLS